LTEEEQIAQLKGWWEENGRSIIIGVVLAVGGYFGWQAWQTQQQQTRDEASLLCEELTQTVVVAPGESLGDDQRMKAASIVEELKSDYGSLLYASDAALLMARVAVEQGALDEAQSHLQWVLDQDRGEAMNLLAALRLAQVQYAQGQLDAALATLDVAEAGSYAAAYAELRGDVLLAKGDTEAARSAYQSALDSLLPEQSSRGDIIEMKLDNVQEGSVNAAPAAQREGSETEGSTEAATEAGTEAGTQSGTQAGTGAEN